MVFSLNGGARLLVPDGGGLDSAFSENWASSRESSMMVFSLVPRPCRGGGHLAKRADSDDIVTC